MDQISKEFGELLQEGSASGPQLSPEELEQQTTNFLLAFIDKMDMTDDQKAKLRSNVIDRALNPEKYQASEDFDKKAGASPEDIMKLIALVALILVVLGKNTCRLISSV